MTALDDSISRHPAGEKREEMAAQLRRQACDAWRLGDEYAKKADAMVSAPDERIGLRDGGDFEIVVNVFGEPTGRTVTVDAHDLPGALHKAAALPFGVWWDDDEEDQP